MQSTLIRAAILAARRNLEDGKGDADHRQDVRDAHYSIYDTLPREETAEEQIEMNEAGELVSELLAFAGAVRGEMPATPTLTPYWARKKDL